MLLALLIASSDLDQSLELYQAGSFTESLTLLEKMLRTEKQAEVIRTAHLYMGMNFLALKNTAQAKASFERVLDSDPDFEVPVLLPPKVKQYFREVKASYKVIPLLTHLAPTAQQADQGVTLVVGVSRMRPGYAVTVRYRKDNGGLSSASLTEKRPGFFEVTLPPALLLASRAYTLEYTFDVRDARGQTLTASTPYYVGVSVPRHEADKPVYQKAWFWTVIVGVAVVGAGAGVAAYFLTRDRPLGDLQVKLRFE